MSADNTVQILKLPEGYRVSEIQASENLYDSSFTFKARYIAACFGKSPLLSTKEEAWKEAARLYEKIRESGRCVEYGIQSIELDGSLEVVDQSRRLEEA